MIGTERLERVLSTIAVSDLVKDGTRAISCALIAPSDAGKSQLVNRFLPPGARILNDFTMATLANVLDQKDPPRWIVVPDFNSVISHRPTVATLTMAFLLPLLAEGITEIPSLDGKAKLQAENLKKAGVRIALLTAMTPDMFFSKRGKWRATGLLRRLIPVFYKYSAQTVASIQATIQSGDDKIQYEQTQLKKMKPMVVDIPPLIASHIRGLSEHVTVEQLCWKSGGEPGDGGGRHVQAHAHPFSVHKTFRSYIRAHGLRHARGVVTTEDFDALVDFSRFVRYDRPEEL